ncbi:hypothetical protein RO3G_16078 [Rhizopus delemar RA 99-880]|uniref:Uncharacterized protein n=1 Tax=Rhizopus delemar (strain RA 99-880 / ATCC MYA-4621 / FGSC 9543 / NRRL 43880) TaxID=246409 RepID=I1CSD7_RHIO9|nr:hypothetical protein RO3G_16078 [Rhizopus delemar RA 99-880]|eukprot:EIE91367.1 hypothetical protein RO3G_16078 [Rhizopus delemar RA 99-880]
MTERRVIDNNYTWPRICPVRYLYGGASLYDDKHSRSVMPGWTNKLAAAL